MKSEKILDAIGMVGDDLVAEAKKKKPFRIRWKALIAVAACIALIIAIVWQSLPEGIPINNRITQPASPDYAYIGWKPTNPTSVYVDEEIGGLKVTVRAIDILPDTYIHYGDWYSEPFRLVKMQTIKTIVGKNMPEEFYLMIPEEFLVDLTQYEALVLLNARQFGYEYNVIYNKTDNAPEAIEGFLFDGHTMSGVIAISNNTFDESLWMANSAWEEKTQYQRESLDEPETEWSCVRRGWTREKIEDAVYNFYSSTSISCFSASEVTNEKGQEALEYICSIENGIFTSEYERFSRKYRRYINGFPTTESIYIDKTKDPTYAGKAFTQADLEKVPDLASAMAAVEEALEKGEILPPHIEDLYNLELRMTGIRGWYTKSASGVFGVIQVNFTYRDVNSKGYSSKDYYYDDIYYIVPYNSKTCYEISRDQLKTLQGTNDFLFPGSYDEHGKIALGFIS